MSLRRITGLTQTEADRHIDMETDNPIAIGEILQICLKRIQIILNYLVFSVKSDMSTSFLRPSRPLE